MKIKSENGNVTFVMKTGKDKVRSTMTINEAMLIVKSSDNVVERDNEIIVDDKYFFPAEIEITPRKKKAKEVTEDE